MNISFASQTDTGRVRTNNEDHFLVDSKRHLFVLCDGMGGHQGGEIASQMCCAIIDSSLQDIALLQEKYAKTGLLDDLKAIVYAFEQALQTACHNIFDASLHQSGHEGMGTTCTALLFVPPGKGILCHVGDSRCYMIRQHCIYQLSDDHTYVNDLVKRGAIDRTQAHNHPQSNILSHAVGIQASTNIDTTVFDIDKNDTYVLCSDGIYNYFPNAQDIANLLHQHDIHVGLNAIINHALQCGGDDNSTGIVIHIDDVITDTTTTDVIHILQDIAMFHGLDDLQLIKLLGMMQQYHASFGDILIEEDISHDSMFILLSGELDLFKNKEHRRVIQPKICLNKQALLHDNAPCYATIKARSEVIFLTLRRTDFLDIMQTDPSIASQFLWNMTKDQTADKDLLV